MFHEIKLLHAFPSMGFLCEYRLQGGWL
jgi:hypothetical protein